LTRWPIPAALIAIFSPVAPAQSGSAQLSGEVRDPSGSLVANARISLTHAGTGGSVTGLTSAAGVYSVADLRPGAYDARVSAAGFRTSVREGIHLFTGEHARLDFQLSLGDYREVVLIRADAPLLRTESGALGQVISNRSVTSLPLNGRSFLPLAGLAPGVALPFGSQLPRINGGRPRVNEYLFDGISVLQPEPGEVPFTPVIEAIQEFRVETNSPPAEFGMFNGGVVNLTTRSGTNEFHGALFEFLRNEALNARNLFAGAKNPLFRRNQFGFAAGGPLRRERTFFFADYQGTRQEIGRIQVSTVPTLLQRQGIFTEKTGGQTPRIYDPATTARSGEILTRQEFPGGIIPQDRFDPVASKLLQRYPLPTAPGTANNYRRLGNETQDQDQGDLRLDHRFTAHDQAFARGTFSQVRAVPVTPLADGSGSISSGILSPTRTAAWSLASSYLHEFSSGFLNDFRFGYTRRATDRSGVRLDDPASAALGVNGIPSHSAFENSLPRFAIDGVQQLGAPVNADSRFRTDVTELVDAVSALKGRHSLRFGADLRFKRMDIVQPPAPTGQFRFSNLFTNHPGTTGTGSALASFLLGEVQDFSIDLQQAPLRPRAWIHEYYIQDDWKLTSRLTLNAGVRYTLDFPSTEVDDQGAIFNTATEQLEFLDRNGFPRSARELHKHDFGPRAGLVYRLSDHTVIRSGYGLIWIEQSGITTPFTTPQFPFLQTASQRTLDNIEPAFRLAAGPSVTPVSATADAGLGQAVYAVDRDLGAGYVQQWNFGVQRQVGANISIEVSYAGSKMTHVGIPDSNINQLTADQLRIGPSLLDRVPNPFYGSIPASSSIGGRTITRAQLLKPFPRFTTVSLYRNNVGNTSYHALQARFEKRLGHGLSLLASYTRSKLIDEASSVFDAAVSTGPVANYPVADSFQRGLERDVSNGDLPNVFAASFVYDLPAGLRGLSGKVLNGWMVAGVVSLQSGLPLAVTQITNFKAFAGFGVQRPDRIADPSLPSSEKTLNRYFNTSAFTTAPQFAIGNSSRNPVRGPGHQDASIALVKRTSLAERMNLEFRAECFNVSNTPPLGDPNVVLGNPAFGTITSAGDPRVVQFGLKLQF
jgi:hypothetical protein